MVQTLLCSCLQHPGILILGVCFDTMVDNCFPSLNEKKQKHHLTFRQRIVSPEIINLKLVSAISYEIFIFSPNDSPSKTIKNVFHFIEKALFILEIFKFL